MINQMVPVLPLYELADHHVVGGALGGCRARAAGGAPVKAIQTFMYFRGTEEKVFHIAY
jgi:hypothetical protein